MKSSWKFSGLVYEAQSFDETQLLFKLSLDVFANNVGDSALSVKLSDLLIYNSISVRQNSWSTFSTIFSLFDDFTKLPTILPIDLIISIDSVTQNQSCYDNKCNQDNIFAVIRNISFSFVPQPEKFQFTPASNANEITPNNDNQSNSCDLLGLDDAVILNAINISPMKLSNQTPRVFCGVFTMAAHHSTKVEALTSTWTTPQPGVRYFHLFYLFYEPSNLFPIQ